MRRQISFAISTLKNNQTVTITARGRDTEKAIRIAEILKLRLGMLHQETALMFTQWVKKGDREAPRSGVTIKLSKMPLDQESIGYQKPKPADYFESTYLSNSLKFSLSPKKEAYF
jgi:DNA-binding protein